MGNFAGIALVVFSATMSNSGGGDDAKIWERDWQFYVGVALPCVAGLVISNVITTMFGLKRPERVTVSIECCYQNVGIATSVALTMFEGQDLAEAMGVPLYYGFVEAVILGIYCLIAWKCNWTKAPSNAPICHVLAMSYEVLRVEKHELESVEVQLGEDDLTSCESLSENENTIFTYFVKFEDALGGEGRKEPSGLAEYEHQREESARSMMSYAE